MAKDLLLGATKRCWARCGQSSDVGQFPHMSPEKSKQLAQDVLAASQVAALAKEVAAGFQRNFNTNLRLHTEGKLPEAERRSLGKLMRQWYDFSRAKDGKFDGADFVALQNFQMANQKWAERLAELDRRSPVVASPAPRPAPSPVLKLSLLNLAVGVAGLYGMSRVVKASRTIGL